MRESNSPYEDFQPSAIPLSLSAIAVGAFTRNGISEFLIRRHYGLKCGGRQDLNPPLKSCTLAFSQKQPSIYSIYKIQGTSRG